MRWKDNLRYINGRMCKWGITFTVYMNRCRKLLLLYSFPPLFAAFTGISGIIVCMTTIVLGIIQIPTRVPFDHIHETRLDNLNVASREMCEGRKFHVAAICTLIRVKTTLTKGFIQSYHAGAYI